MVRQGGLLQAQSAGGTEAALPAPGLAQLQRLGNFRRAHARDNDLSDAIPSRDAEHLVTMIDQQDFHC